MSKRQYKEMSNTIPSRKKKKATAASKVEQLTIPLVDLKSLINIAQYSKNHNIVYPNINNATLQSILPQLSSP